MNYSIFYLKIPTIYSSGNFLKLKFLSGFTDVLKLWADGLQAHRIVSFHQISKGVMALQ